MCLWCYASSPVQHQGLLKDKWLLIKHILSPHLFLPLLSGTPCQCSFAPSSPAPIWGGQVARPWGGGIGRLHTEIDYPSNLGTASVSPGQKLRHDPPPPNSHPFSVSLPPLSLSPLSLFLHPFHPSVPVLPEALRDDTKSQLQTGPLARSACLVRHMSWQMGLPWTLPWTHRKKKNDKGRWIRDWKLHELGNRVEQKIQPACIQRSLKSWCSCGICADVRETKTIRIKQRLIAFICSRCWWALCLLHSHVIRCRAQVMTWHPSNVHYKCASRTWDVWQLVKVTIVLGDGTTCHLDGLVKWALLVALQLSLDLERLPL